MKGGIILKKFLAVLLAVLMVFSMAACGGGGGLWALGLEQPTNPGDDSGAGENPVGIGHTGADGLFLPAGQHLDGMPGQELLRTHL